MNPGIVFKSSRNMWSLRSFFPRFPQISRKIMMTERSPQHKTAISRIPIRKPMPMPAFCKRNGIPIRMSPGSSTALVSCLMYSFVFASIPHSCAMARIEMMPIRNILIPTTKKTKVACIFVLRRKEISLNILLVSFLVVPHRQAPVDPAYNNKRSKNPHVPAQNAHDPHTGIPLDAEHCEHTWRNGQHNCRNQIEFYIFQNVFSGIAIAVAFKMDNVSTSKKKQAYSDNAEDPDRRNLCRINQCYKSSHLSHLSFSFSISCINISSRSFKPSLISFAFSG